MQEANGGQRTGVVRIMDCSTCKFIKSTTKDGYYCGHPLASFIIRRVELWEYCTRYEKELLGC